MTTKPHPAEKLSARERLLAAAEELFYLEGINTVGIDRVIEHAGVAKASLYNTFGSKDELIRAYLAARHEGRKERMARHLEGYATPRDKILGVFDYQQKMIGQADFRGCAFIRASAELSTDSKLRAVCDESRDWMHGLLRDLATEAGAADPSTLARQLVILYEGAAVAWNPDQLGGASKMAREAAICLLAASGIAA
jgi:AcrR family transcriptional regulator